MGRSRDTSCDGPMQLLKHGFFATSCGVSMLMVLRWTASTPHAGPPLALCSSEAGVVQDELRGDDANGAAPAAEVPDALQEEADAATRPDEDLGELQHAGNLCVSTTTCIKPPTQARVKCPLTCRLLPSAACWRLCIVSCGPQPSGEALRTMRLAHAQGSSRVYLSAALQCCTHLPPKGGRFSQGDPAGMHIALLCLHIWFGRPHDQPSLEQRGHGHGAKPVSRHHSKAWASCSCLL